MADDIADTVEAGEEKQEIQAKIEVAMRSRIQYFKEQSDSLTLASVRRLLEKDLGLDKNSLDVHKRFISQFLEKQMEGADDDDSKTEVENVEKDAQLNEKEVGESPPEHKTKKAANDARNGDEEILEDSPVMGLLDSKSEVDNQGSVISESRIKKAIWDRADHFLANSAKITLAGVRRLLEEDLGLEKNTLDAFKKLISEQIDEVLNLDNLPKNANHAKKKKSVNSRKKASETISSVAGSDLSGDESNEEKEKVRSRKQVAAKSKDKKSDGLKKRKRSAEDRDPSVSGKNQSVRAKKPKEEANDSENEGSGSEDDQSQSSVGKPVKRKEQSTPAYGKQVDNLRSIIKSCGMSVGPTVYKKAKQVPEGKREAFLVKELEGILKKEGLSSNPTEKEIKDCRKRKERAKELEGIDMSNIISSSRRRSASSFWAPKPKVETKANEDDDKASKRKEKLKKDGSDGDEAEDEDNKKEKDGNDSDEHEEKKEKAEDDEKVEEEEDEGDDEEDEEDEGEEDDDDSQSEEFNEGIHLVRFFMPTPLPLL